MIQLPFHLVELSPWPMMCALSSMFTMMGLINWFHFHQIKLLIVATVMMTLSLSQWWRDIIREATFMGKHTSHVQTGLRLGMTLFILSEICFFATFFWAFFHMSLVPSKELGCVWPPMGIIPINPFNVPLLNTMVLLASSLTVTSAHHCLLAKKQNKATMSLMLTISLGAYFTFLQITEYNEAPFTIADSVYGSIFFMSTGFHGVHVMIGTLFLSINLVRTLKTHFSKTHHFSLEAAAWYWHFVDVVWICLYVCIYWWGSL